MTPPDRPNVSPVLLGVPAHPDAGGAYQPSAAELDPEAALRRALEITRTDKAASHASLVTTKHRTITRRAVLWLGQTCNLRCYFCYFLDRIESKAHPEHDFMDLDKAKEICDALVRVYGNNAI